VPHWSYQEAWRPSYQKPRMRLGIFWDSTLFSTAFVPGNRGRNNSPFTMATPRRRIELEKPASGAEVELPVCTMKSTPTPPGSLNDNLDERSGIVGALKKNGLRRCTALERRLLRALLPLCGRRTPEFAKPAPRLPPLSAFLGEDKLSGHTHAHLHLSSRQSSGVLQSELSFAGTRVNGVVCRNVNQAELRTSTRNTVFFRAILVFPAHFVAGCRN